jgi:hypothetical protein
MSNNFKNKVKELYDLKCSKYDNINEKNVLPAVDKIVVIGDIHGDFQKTIECLKLAKVLQEDTKYGVNNPKRYKWIGDDTVIVQVGDQIDRCRNLPCNDPLATDPDENSDIKILKFFTDLHFKALKKGGAVYSLVGNHELMNVVGRMDYVSYKGIKGFENEDQYGSKIYQDKLPTNIKDMDARKYTFKPGNPLSEYIACTRKLVLKIGDYLFVHAGILPIIAEKYPGDQGIETMNNILSAYLFNSLDKEEIEKHQMLLGPEIVEKELFSNGGDMSYYDISPLWNRKYGHLSRSNDILENAEVCSNYFNPIKSIYNVNKMFIGHTPQTNKINASCDNGLWFTDIAMSKAFGGFGKNQAQVLLIEKGKEPKVIM